MLSISADILQCCTKYWIDFYHICILFSVRNEILQMEGWQCTASDGELAFGRKSCSLSASHCWCTGPVVQLQRNEFNARNITAAVLNSKNTRVTCIWKLSLSNASPLHSRVGLIAHSSSSKLLPVVLISHLVYYFRKIARMCKRN